MSEPHDGAGVYVTHALDPDEHREFEAHLDHCEECRVLVRELRETLADASKLYEVTPPTGLRDSILHQISNTPMLAADDHAAHARPRTAANGEETHPNVVRGNFERKRNVMAGLAAAAALLAVALGGVTVWQQSELQSLQAAESQRIELLLAPDLQVSRAALGGVDLTYLVSRSLDEGMITSVGLPNPGEDRTWQVWLLEGETPRSAAVVDDNEGPVQIVVDAVAGGSGMAITNEPRGGSDQPTTDPQAVVQFRDV